MNKELYKEISRYDVDGVCSSCKEWTNVLESCCGAWVSYEGHGLCAEDDFTQEEIEEYINIRDRRLGDL